jgi:hypothetical protein
MVTAVSVFDFMAFAGVLSGPAAFLFLSVAMVFLVSTLECLSQLMDSPRLCL